MKKFTKFTLITAMVLGIAGVVLLGAGVVSGASLDSFKKNIENSRYFSRWVSWRDWDDFEDDFEDEWEEMEEELDDYGESHHPYVEDIDGMSEEPVSTALNADKVDEFHLEVSAGAAEIKVTSGNEIKVSGLYPSDILSFEEGDRELYLERGHEDYNRKEKLVIEIPENKKFQELSLHSSAGNIITTGKLSARETDLSSETGNLEVEFLESRESDIECSSGNIKVKFAGKLDDYEIDVESDSCNLKLDGKNYAGWQEGVFGTLGSGNTIEIEGITGNMEIAFENK